jgi:hypothetical protein
MAQADVKARKMAINLEKSQGGQIQKVPSSAGYDVRVIYHGLEKHIEAKGIDRNDTFFAINGLKGISNLLFDDKYYIYFCDVNAGMVLISTKDFVFKNVGWESSKDIKKLIRAWTDTADAIRGISQITVDGRIRFVLRHPVRKLIRDIQQKRAAIDNSLRETIVALWKHHGRNRWSAIYSR